MRSTPYHYRQLPDLMPSIGLAEPYGAASRVISCLPTVNSRALRSVHDGTEKEGSDLGLLVEDILGANLFSLRGKPVELEQPLGVPVDLVFPGDLPAKLRVSRPADARPV